MIVNRRDEYFICPDLIPLWNILEIKIKKVDRLSRRPDWIVKMENNDENKKTNKGGIDSRFDRDSSKRTRSRVERRQVADKRTSVERGKTLE